LWHHARTCPFSRQGTAAAADPHACISKGYSSTAPCTPLQHLWGSKTHTRAQIHTHTYIHTCMRTRTHIRKQTRAQIHTGAHTHIHTHKHSDTHAQTRRHTSAHTHTHSHMHMHTHMVRVMGFAKISASLAMLPHLSILSIVL